MILFLPSSNPSLELMSKVARWMFEQGHSVAIVANNNQQCLLKDLGEPGCEVLDFKTLKRVDKEMPPFKSQSQNSSKSLISIVLASLVRKIEEWHSSKGSLVIVILAIYWALQSLRFRFLWRREVVRLNCSVAFIWWDNAATSNGELLNLLKAQGALLVHLPIALSDRKIIARLRAGSEVMQIGAQSALVSRALAFFCPDQVFNFESHRLFFYHPAEILAMALLRNLPSKPWVLGASRADIVCFTDIYQRDYWVKCGLDVQRARIVGNLDLQDIALDISRLFNDHARLFKRVIPLVLINMPNLVEHNTLPNWDSFWALVYKMFAPLVGHEVEIVVSLHPKSDPNNYIWLTERYGCLVTQGNIGAWIGCADLYISMCSSTEIIANDFGVPVLDIGLIFGFESDVLRSLPKITFLDNYQDYEKVARSQLDDLTKQPRRFQKIGSRSSMTASISPFEELKSIIDTEIKALCSPK